MIILNVDHPSFSQIPFNLQMGYHNPSVNGERARNEFACFRACIFFNRSLSVKLTALPGSASHVNYIKKRDGAQNSTRSMIVKLPGFLSGAYMNPAIQTNQTSFH